MTFLERQLENPQRLATIKRCFYVGLALIAAVEIVAPLVFHGAHHHFAFEGFPAFGSLYGLISCVVIIVASKLIGKMWLMRREDYYDS